MPPVGFEPTISARERPQTYALKRAATGTGNNTRIIHTINDNYFSRRRLMIGLSNGHSSLKAVTDVYLANGFKYGTLSQLL